MPGASSMIPSDWATEDEYTSASIKSESAPARATSSASAIATDERPGEPTGPQTATRAPDATEVTLVVATEDPTRFSSRLTDCAPIHARRAANEPRTLTTSSTPIALSRRASGLASPSTQPITATWLAWSIITTLASSRGNPEDTTTTRTTPADDVATRSATSRQRRTT